MSAAATIDTHALTHATPTLTIDALAMHTSDGITSKSAISRVDATMPPDTRM
jgi:hypothetical protein